MKQPRQYHGERGPHYLWGSLLFIGIMTAIISIGMLSVNKYSIYYNNLNRVISEQGDTTYTVDMMDIEAVEYSWFNTVDAHNIAEYDWYTTQGNKADSICVLAVFKNGKLQYKNKLNTINLFK